MNQILFVGFVQRIVILNVLLPILFVHGVNVYLYRFVIDHLGALVKLGVGLLWVILLEIIHVDVGYSLVNAVPTVVGPLLGSLEDGFDIHLALIPDYLGFLSPCLVL